LAVDLIEGSILENMKKVLDMAQKLGNGNEFPFDYMETLIRERRRVDNLIFVSNTLIGSGHTDYTGPGGVTVSSMLNKYRQEVNPDLLFVSIDLSGRPQILQPQENKHKNDIFITGFSDSILRFIAERGDDNQLHYVENIDIAKKIPRDLTKTTALNFDEIHDDTQYQTSEDYYEAEETTVVEKWRTARVFISSTFLDMHGERDILTRHVFPELKERCKKRRINLVEVDLRWGVTEHETQLNQSVQICLDEVDRCRPFFLGLLGNRYGWAPKEYHISDETRFDWLKEYPKERSITELEIEYGCLRDSKPKGLFYVRDYHFIRRVPEQYRRTFVSVDQSAH